MTISSKRLAANRINCKLGGMALREKADHLYFANPTFCKQCTIILPRQKKNNSFCSRSCAAKFNNAHRSPTAKKTGPKPKDKEPKAAYSTLYKCICKHCGIEWRARKSQRICEQHRDLYSHHGRAKFWFTFNVFNYPALFDLSLIYQYGFRSSSNPNGITRDHKVSVNEAILNNYDPYYIKHPLNCELMLFEQNNKKKTKSSILYIDLVNSVDKFDKDNGFGNNVSDIVNAHQSSNWVSTA